MTAIAWWFFALWAVTVLVGAWFFGWAWLRHERDLRLLRHMAQGQAEAQRNVLGRGPWVEDVGLPRVDDAGNPIAPAVRASREVH